MPHYKELRILLRGGGSDENVLPGGKPIWLQATVASGVLQASSQTVPQEKELSHTSTRPSLLVAPPTSLMSPSEHTAQASISNLTCANNYGQCTYDHI